MDNKYDSLASDTYKITNPYPAFVSYGTGQMYGYISSDRVCLTETACASKIDFLSAVETEGLNSVKADGIVGLAPSSQGSQAELFVTELVRNGLISN